MAAWKNLDFDFGVHKNHPTVLEGMPSDFFWRSTSGRKSVVKFFSCDFSCGFAKN